MFEAITDSIRGALSLIDRGRLTESNIREGLLQVRKALLEADVNYEVALDFVNRVTEQAVGEQVLKSLRPSEQIVGIVYQELVNLMGPVDHSLHLRRGEVVATWHPKPGTSIVRDDETAHLTLHSGEWVIAVARGNKPMTWLHRYGAMPFAFTNPIWVR